MRTLGVGTVLVGGVHTNIGVETTVRDAYDREVNVIVASDACASYSEAHRYSLEQALPRFSRVLPLAEARSAVAAGDGVLR